MIERVPNWYIDQFMIGTENFIPAVVISPTPLRIIRSNQTWRVVESFSGVSHCLERLAYRKGYRVADVCATLGCSIRYLHTLFVRDIGLPPKHWMKLERMVVARRKLEGGKSPEEVSTELGFMSIHTFNRQFLQFYQTTPAKFQSDRILFDPTKTLEIKPVKKAQPRKLRKPRNPGDGE